MDSKTVKPSKKRLKPNVIDFLIILAVIGAVIGIALRAGVVEKIVVGNNRDKARVSFYIQNINEQSCDYMDIGDTYYSPTIGTDFGVLESTQFMPAELYIPSLDGKLVKTFSENNRMDVRGTFVCSGTFGESGFLLDGTNYIAPGSVVNVQSSTLDVSLTVTDIEKISE